MSAKFIHKPEQEVIAAIQALDLESVKARVMDPALGEGWSHAYANEIEAAYKTYLTMVVKYQEHAEDILLSKDVDEFWHTHILQTAKYADDCQRVFGTFIHHNPHVGAVTAEVHAHRDVLAAKTRRLYELEFGGTAQAQTAWAGNVGRDAAAMSNLQVRGDNAAMSNLQVHSDNAAMSNLAIVAGKSAMSNLQIAANAAAMSNLQIRSGSAAMSNLQITAGQAAMSNLQIAAGDAAMSNLQIRAESAAMSNLQVKQAPSRLAAGFA